MKRIGILALAALAVGLAVSLLAPRQAEQSAVTAGGATDVSGADRTVSGEALFAATCAACHGARGGGTDQGPPLVHRIYEPGHHPDIAFQVAVQNGVRAHHWRFGNMPPQPQVSQSDVTAIVAYVRSLQRAQGIN